MQLNDTFPIQKLVFIIILFVAAWEVRASENVIKPELMGLAVRSAEGVFLLSDTEIPLANIPINFFALFLKDVEGAVELDLSGPINIARRELAEPYGLFSDVEFKSLPAGHYALTVKVLKDGKIQNSYAFDFEMKPATHTGSTEKISTASQKIQMKGAQAQM